MPLFRPSILFSDAYGSAGSLTFYHRNGKCYTRKRVKPSYPGTPAQLEHLAVHRRALKAWAGLDAEIQKEWISYEKTAEPHRPPFDHKAHISGNNLFVSAYHGFALMGDEHTPEPQPFRMPPPFHVSFERVAVEDGVLIINVDAHVPPDAHPERYRMYSRLRLTTPGRDFGVKGMKGFLAEGNCSGHMTIRIPSYTEIWSLTEERFQIQALSILLDSETGFRSQNQRTTAIIEPNCQ
ncbi:MAG: hypothetical protein IJ654_00685 [Bacteroidales bacterium]|nr:hypothetical protein [Bacteroidales bacterium]